MRVKSGVAPQTVALWERDPRHPTGEVFIAGEGAVDVHLTPTVQHCLKTGVLVAVDVPGASTNDEGEPTTKVPVNIIPLTAVRGIGKVMATALQEMGIHTLADLIAADAATLDVALPTNARAITDWQAQAQELLDATP